MCINFRHFQSLPLSVLAFVTCVKLTKVVRFTMVAHRVNMHYSTREAVKLVLNEGLDLEDFSDNGSDENIVDLVMSLCQ